MSLRGKFLSTLALGAAFAAFSVAAIAQDTQPPASQGGTIAPDNKAPRRGFGKHEDGFRRGPGGESGMLGELRGIDLTDAQKQQIHTIMESNKPDQSSMEQMRTLTEAKRNGTLTADQQAQLKVFHQQRMAKGKQIHDQVMAILTPEQLQQVEQRRKEMKERWEQHRQQQDQNKQTAPVKPTDN
jgi:Spy/CpxP family protein refolding chaperone